MGMIYILTLYNKPEYVDDAIASVKSQTRACIHIIKRDEYNTQGLYPPAVFINYIVKQLPVDSYWAWLSDDDLLLPNYVVDLAGWLDTHPSCNAVYGVSEHIMFDRNTGYKQHVRTLPATNGYPVFNAQLSPYCVLDGGQFMVRRSIMDSIPYPWYPEDQTGCSVCDGTFASKLANICGIYPLMPMKQVMVNRATPRSSHSVMIGGALRGGDWVQQRGIPVEHLTRVYTPTDVTIVVVEYNTLEMTRVCLEHLVTFYPDARMILIDNGSTDGSAQYISLVATARHGIAIFNSNNIGHGPAMHQALQHCKTKYALMLDSDTVTLKGDWIERMLDVMLHDDKVYATGALIHVNDAGDVSGTGHEYVHPARMLIDVEKYRLLTPFNVHGAPCALNMYSAVAAGYKLVQFDNMTMDGDEFVKHTRGGTHKLLGSIPGWTGEGHFPQNAVSAEVMIAGTRTQVINVQ